MKPGKKRGLLDRILASPLSVFFILLTLVCISYSNSLNSPLVLDDDSSFVDVQKIYIKDFSLKSIQQLSTTRFGKARLLPLMSFALDHRLGSSNIVQFHLTNLIIHLLATVALYLFLQAMLITPVGKQGLAFLSPIHFCLFVTALWALHPVQTNAVTYIVQRMTSMAAMFYLASLAFYVHARICGVGLYRYFLYVGCLFSAICAFQSKENSATIPIAIFLVEFLLISPDLIRRIMVSLKWRHLLIMLSIFLILFPVFIMIWNAVTSGYDMRYFTMSERLFTEFRIVVFYISLLMLPLPGRMNLDHDFFLSHSLFSPPGTALSLFIIIALLVWGLRVRKKQPLIALGIFLFFLNLIIESTVIPLELIFEHRLYLPSVGFFIVVISLLDRWSSSISRYNRKDLQRIVFLGVIIVSIIFSLLTTARNYVWRDTLSLYGDCARKSPDKPRALSNYGLALAGDGKYEESIFWFEKAITKGRPFYEEYLRSANNILASLHALEEYEQAVNRGEEYLSKVTVELNGEGFPKFLYNLGISYQMVGRYNDALSAFTKGIRLKRPDTWYLIHGMEVTLLRAAGSEEGRKELELSDKQVDIPIKMAYILMQLKEYSSAGKYIEKAEEVDPENEILEKIKDVYERDLEKSRLAEQLSDIRNHPPYINNKLFRLYMTIADFVLEKYPPLASQAGWFVERAAKIEPADSFVAAYKARWLIKIDKLNSAIEVLEKAILENSDFPPILELAGSCYLKTEQPDKASLVFQHLLNIYPNHAKWRFYENAINVINETTKSTKDVNRV